jgi:AcrB/AcrD/AcrF family protein
MNTINWENISRSFGASRSTPGFLWPSPVVSSALWLRGIPFSITTAVGFIALSGVAVLNGLVIISYFNQLREEVMKCGEQVSASHMNSVWPCLGV